MKMDAVTFAEQFLNKNVLLDDIKKEGEPTETDFQRIGEALELSAKDPDTNDYDTLLLVAVDCLRTSIRLPVWLATFIADVLEGKQKRPTKRGADKYANWERDYKLWRATQEVAKTFDLQHYSNNELSSKVTAADIVSSASGCKIGVVINAYKKFNRMGGKIT